VHAIEGTISRFSEGTAAIISVGLQGLDVLGLPLSDLRETHVWMAGLATSYG